MFQQPLFALDPAPIADHLAVRADDPVAGDDDANRILIVGHSHGPKGLRLADSLRHVSVGDHLSVRDFSCEVR